jgi:hypothetical protein
MWLIRAALRRPFATLVVVIGIALCYAILTLNATLVLLLLMSKPSSSTGDSLVAPKM